MADDQPQAGWVTFEGDRLLIGEDPTLGFLERDDGLYGATWWPDGPPDGAEGPDDVAPENLDVFEEREVDSAWSAAVEICASSKGRLDFEGVRWSHVWLRFTSTGEEWAQRARESKPESGLSDGVAGFEIEPGEDGGCILAPSENGSLFGRTTRWRVSPEGLESRTRRFGLESSDGRVDREHIYVVPILSSSGPGDTCTVAIAGEGLFVEICEGLELGAALELRHILVASLAGELLPEWRPGTR